MNSDGGRRHQARRRNSARCPEERLSAQPNNMYLIEFLLPTFGNDGRRFPKSEFDRVRGELTDRFGGVTAYMRSPAVGLWSDDTGHIHRDELAQFEVMTDSFDRDWWRQYRQELEQRFHQDEVVVRGISFERL